jgi:hypothetical protein
MYTSSQAALRHIDQQGAFLVLDQKGNVNNIFAAVKNDKETVSLPLILNGEETGAYLLDNLRGELPGFDRKIWHVGLGPLPFFLWDKYLVTLDDMPAGKTSIFISNRLDNGQVFAMEKNYIFVPRQNLKLGDTIGLYSEFTEDSHGLLMLHVYHGEENIVFKPKHIPGLSIISGQNKEFYFDNQRIRKSVRTLQDNGFDLKKIPVSFPQKAKDRFLGQDIHVEGDFYSDALLLLEGKLHTKNDLTIAGPLLLFNKLTLQGDNVTITDHAQVFGLDDNLTMIGKRILIEGDLGVGASVVDNIVLNADEINVKGTWMALHNININGHLNLLGDTFMVSGLGKIHFGSISGSMHTLLARTYKGITFNGSVGEDVPLKKLVLQKTKLSYVTQQVNQIDFNGDIHVIDDLNLRNFSVVVGDNVTLGSEGSMFFDKIRGGRLMFDKGQVHMLGEVYEDTLTDFRMGDESQLFLYNNMHVREHYDVRGQVYTMKDLVYIDALLEEIMIGNLEDNIFMRQQDYVGDRHESRTLIFLQRVMDNNVLPLDLSNLLMEPTQELVQKLEQEQVQIQEQIHVLEQTQELLPSSIQIPSIKNKYDEYKERLDLLYTHGTNNKNNWQYGLAQVYLHSGQYNFIGKKPDLTDYNLDPSLSFMELKLNTLNKHADIDLLKIYYVQ